ncbi:GNAT family N-acetyltransferase [Kineococcus rubinsiae]|uniref:GNAT family N-acetyltransferase n=1 Tax=Kineococcus rubinsiae TaxID=2609562 RepID=UPI0014315001|nr:GNAT family N-acetyltransferase [Kineococcus rubinsiae]
MPSPDLTFTTVDTADAAAVDAWSRVPRAAFLEKAADEADLAARRRQVAGHRLRAAYDGDRPVGTFRSYDLEVTMPGAGPVTVDAISSVAVLPTHRRRRILSTLMGTDLAEARESGHALAALIAMEAPIYGRFGFGPATRSTQWTLDCDRTAFRPDAPGADGGSLELVDPAAERDLLAGLHDTMRRGRPGGLQRPAVDWDEWFTTPGPRRLGRGAHVAVHRDAAGTADGYVVYELTESWDARVSTSTGRVLDLTATTTAAYRDLWEFVASIDLVRTLTIPDRPADELLPQLLVDPRAARHGAVDDFLWLRVLDVAGALCARRYLGQDSLVLRVEDPRGITGGTVRLHVSGENRGEDGFACAEVTASTDEPDVVLGVGDLATLLLGDASAVPLARAGRLHVAGPDRAVRLGALFATPESPWCQTWF